VPRQAKLSGKFAYLGDVHSGPKASVPDVEIISYDNFGEDPILMKTRLV